MSNRQIALSLTAAYWIVAVAAAMVAPRGGWIDLRWPIAIYFFAIPTTILLWMVAIGVHVFRPALPRSRFALIGIALPLIYVALGMGAGHLLGEWRGQHLEDQLRVASIAEFDDEPLSGDRGPSALDCDTAPFIHEVLMSTKVTAHLPYSAHPRHAIRSSFGEGL